MEPSIGALLELAPAATSQTAQAVLFGDVSWCNFGELSCRGVKAREIWATTPIWIKPCHWLVINNDFSQWSAYSLVFFSRELWSSLVSLASSFYYILFNFLPADGKASSHSSHSLGFKYDFDHGCTSSITLFFTCRWLRLIYF
jgi:hypothetical protein